MAGITLTIEVDDRGTVKVKQFADESKKAMKEMTEGPKAAKGPVDDLMSSWVGLTAKIAVASAAIYGAVRTIGDFVSEAAEAEQVQHRLGYAVQTAGYSWEYYKVQTDAWAESIMKATRFTDEEARTALTQMLMYTTDMTKAQQGAQLAMDMSVRTGQDLYSTTRLIGMAMTGNVEMLGRYLPQLRNLNDLLGSNASMDQKAAYALRELTNLFSGTAQADIATYSGKVKQFENAWKELKESIGTDALPALSSVFDWLTKIVNKMREQRELVKEQGGGFWGGWGKAPPGSAYMGVPSKAVFGEEEGIPEPGKKEILDPFVKLYGMTESELKDRMEISRLYRQGWLEDLTRDEQLWLAEQQSIADTYAALWSGAEMTFPTEDILPDFMQIERHGQLVTVTKDYFNLLKEELLETSTLLSEIRMQPGGPWTGAEFTYPTEDILPEWTKHPKTGKPVLVDQWKNETNQMLNIFNSFSDNISSVWSENVNGIIKGTTTIKDAFKNMATGMADVFISAVTKMIANWVLFGNMAGQGFGAGGSKSPSAGSGWLGILGTIGSWLGLQEGGVFNRPTPAIIAEAGNAEAVVPLKSGKIPIEGGGGKGDTYITYIEATDLNSFERRYGPVIESIYFKGKRLNKVALR